MNILFSHSYFLRFDPKQWALGQPYPPLGTIYAAALMRDKGYHVSLFDTMFSATADEIQPVLDAEKPSIFVIYDDGFNYLTKMCLTNMREAAFSMIQMAKNSGCTVIVSGSDSTDRYREYLEQGADFVMIGEAEQTLAELTDQFRSHSKDFQQIAGLAFKAESGIITTQKRNVLRDLDNLPMPAWDLVDMDAYRKIWLRDNGYLSLNMGTTRGCPFKCNWCAKPIYGNRYNSRSPQNVVDELIFLKERYHFDHIWFCDDIFGLKPGWVLEFASLVEKANLKFRFKIQSRADLLLEADTIKSLARAGCDNVWIGAESGSQKILNAMDKGITVDQIRKAAILLKENGIKPSFFIQFGYPGETREDIQKTIDMINELLPFSIGISVSYPLPGTVFYESVKAELGAKSNWTDSDELALMFKNTYSPAFYKQLHRYVQRNYRKHLALREITNLLRQPATLTMPKIRKAISACYYVPLAFLAKQKLHSLEKI